MCVCGVEADLVQSDVDGNFGQASVSGIEVRFLGRIYSLFLLFSTQPLRLLSLASLEVLLLRESAMGSWPTSSHLVLELLCMTSTVWYFLSHLFVIGWSHITLGIYRPLEMVEMFKPDYVAPIVGYLISS